jgi:asparagine synthase (glutamine-hydrolysing)
MCGIIGIISPDIEEKRKNIKHSKLISHRGPDDEGFTAINKQTGNTKCFSGDDTILQFKSKHPHISTAELDQYDVILGHRRLSIIDLSENGHGPMSDSSGKIWLTFNGEIYNYIELRRELEAEGYIFKSHTDTEVIIYSYIKWGENCLNKFNGMWAFALWDGRINKLFIARDRFGIKPLYYFHQGNTFAFCSEIKPLALAGKTGPEVDEKRIPFFVLYGNRLNTPDTYISHVKSLQPSHFLTFTNNKISIKRYYDIAVKEITGNEDKLKQQLTELFTDSIKLHYRSDVKVGTCLSGGFDSSSIVAFSNLIDRKELDTFSAVWNDKDCDESKYIDIVNKRFGCHPNKIVPQESEFDETFSRIHYAQEIPTEGPGLYPQWYVMNKASSRVKVLLDGQGGDEVFGGYYQIGSYLRSLIKDKKGGSILKNLNSYFTFLNKHGIHSFSSWLFPQFYNKVVRANLSEQFKIIKTGFMERFRKEDLYFDADPPTKFKNYLNDLSYHFINTLTIPTLLHYEDRSSMAFSIESRVPFLDYRLVEFGVNLPPKYLVEKNTSRPLYRRTVEKFLPEQIVKRKDKLGYPTPFTKWTRSTLKNYVSDVLMSKDSLIYKYLDIEYVKTNLVKHFNNKTDYGWGIWRLLALEKILNIYRNLK